MLKINFTCPACGEDITGWLSHFEYGDEPPNNEQPILHSTRGCESGGIYDMYIECPKCEAELDIYN